MSPICSPEMQHREIDGLSATKRSEMISVGAAAVSIQLSGQLVPGFIVSAAQSPAAFDLSATAR